MTKADEEARRSEDIGGIKATLMHIEKALEKQDSDSSAWRRKIYGALDDVKKEQGGIRHEVDTLAAAIAAITPETRQFTQWRMQAEGAGKLGKVLWWLGGVLLSGAAGAYGMLQWLSGK
jgi:hypothetical protein